MNAIAAVSFPSSVRVLVATLLGAGAVLSRGAEPGAADATIVERGPHHRVWERANVRTLPNGRSVTNRSSFVELETFLHYQNPNGEWTESKSEIELFQDGAVARQGPHQVIFAPNLNTAGAIDLLTPGGGRMRSHILGLGLYDHANQTSTLIAELKDSIGELHPPNVILYRSAFDGVAADVRYTYQKGNFIQDVIVLENIVLPEGFNPATTQLEIWTEFLEAPTPARREQLRAGLTDESLDFGTMQIGPGRAFSLGQGDAPAVSAPVQKRWLQIQGRTFLVEGVQFQSVKGELDRLPAPRQQAAVGRPARPLQIARVNAGHRPFPAARAAKPKVAGEKIQMAGLPPPTRGLVLDYDLSGSLTNYVFRADSTYYISGTVTLRNPTFEGGCVIKFSNTNAPQLWIPVPSAGFTWLATAYRPVVLTGRDDHSVGETIGTNLLSGYYARFGLNFSSSTPIHLEHLRVSHAIVGVGFDENPNTNRHAQFIHCGNAFEVQHAHSHLENVLFYQVTNVLGGRWDDGVYSVRAAHLTIHNATNFNVNDLGGEYFAYITNSIAVNLGSWNCELTTNAVIQTTETCFQIVGAGAHYLAANSPYRNAGVTNLSARLLADLKTLTTYPPVVITPGALTNNLTLYPQAQRDTDQPDLGCHYSPIDYAFGHVWATDATIAVNPGVVIGTYATNDYYYGLAMLNNSTLAIEGTPANSARIVRHNTVQEQANTNWGARLLECTASPWLTTAVAPQMRFRFVDWSALAQDSHHFHGYSESDFTAVFRDCQFHGGTLVTERPAIAITNSLFERVGVSMLGWDYTFDVNFRNSTFRGGSLILDQYNGGTWTLKDNLFDQTAISTVGSITHDYNAYVTNANRIGTAAAHDKTLTNAPVYQTNWLGRYYFPTNDGMLSTLLNAGSITANNLGLYHFTTTTNQVKETNSTVDIGFHYVAVNSSGQPIDTDSDGLPDYYEDIDGDGAIDSGETSPGDSSDWGLKVLITRPRRSGTIP